MAQDMNTNKAVLKARHEHGANLIIFPGSSQDWISSSVLDVLSLVKRPVRLQSLIWCRHIGQPLSGLDPFDL